MTEEKEQEFWTLEHTSFITTNERIFGEI